MSAHYGLHVIHVAREGPCGWQSPTFAVTLGAVRRPFFGGMTRANRRGLIGLQ